MKNCIICNNDVSEKNNFTIHIGTEHRYICADCIKKMNNQVINSERKKNINFKKGEFPKVFRSLLETYIETIDKIVTIHQITYITKKISFRVIELIHINSDTSSKDDIFAEAFAVAHDYLEDVLLRLYSKEENKKLNKEEFISKIKTLFNEDIENYLDQTLPIIEEINAFEDRMVEVMPEKFEFRATMINRAPYPISLEDDEEEEKQDKIALRTPKTIKAELDKRVIGQEKAKKVLSVGIYNHYKRIMNNKENVAKSNIMLIGSTGVGKTELARSVAKILDVPFVIADSTSITSAGYVGGDVEDMLLNLINAADGNIKKAERGIIYIDEIDKIARNEGNGKDIGGEGVQQALLKIVEGNEVTIKLRKGNMEKRIQFDTSNVLFICGGAFEGLTMKEEPKNKVTLGFNSVEIPSEENKKIDVKALVKYGMIPELIGRFPIIVQLEDLQVEDLKRILVEPENSIISQYKDLLEVEDVELDFTDKALTYIATKAYDNHTGARGLNTIIEDSIMDLMYELPDEDNVSKIKVGIKQGELYFKREPESCK